ncbi:allantoinase PuuE [soil metagenome]
MSGFDAGGPEIGGPPRDLVGYGRFPPKVRWPGGATVAVNVVIVYEEGSEQSLLEGDGVNEGWGEYAIEIPPPLRDLGTETHFEYGSRAGIWRLARIIEAAGAPVTVSATARALELNPEVASWIVEHGHDVLGHGDRWVPVVTMTRAEEQAALASAVERYQRVLGRRPIGWNTRSFPSIHTRELLVEEGGFAYDSDPCNDDVPYTVSCLGQDLLVVPYSKTLNDSRYLMSPGFASPQQFVECVEMALAALVADGAHDGVGRMMTIAFHARWSGQPSRAEALRRILTLVRAEPRAVLMRRDDIASWWVEHVPA